MEDGWDDVDDVEDPDSKNDPIYHVKIEEYVKQFMKGLIASDPNGVQQLGVYFTQMERESLQEIINSQ